MVKTVTSIQVTANDTVAFYNGTDVVMTLSQIMPPSVYIDYTNTSIVIYNQANSSDEKTRFEFPAVYVQQVGANSYTKLNSYALQTEITARVMQVYKDLTTEIFKGCCEAGGCQADGCSILYRYNSELNEGDWYYDTEGGLLCVSMNSFSNQLFDTLLPAMPIDSWVTFISSADSTLYTVFQITNAGTIVGGYVQYEATLVDGSSSFPVNTVFCFNLMAAGGSPVIGITSGNAGINVGGSYPSYTISNAMTVSAGTGITVTGSYPNYVINSNAAGVTLASAGGTESLVNDGTGPTLAIKGITAGSGISLSSTGAALTISSTGASGVTSVGLSMPPAFTVTNSPVTSSGTLTATANGNSSQYIDGTGSLQTFPSPQGLQSVITTNNNLTTTNTIIGNNNSLTWSGSNKFEIFPNASGYFLVTVGKYPPDESQIKITALAAEMFTTSATTQKFKTDSTTLYIQTPNVSSGAASAGQVLTLGNATTGAVEYTTITSNPGTVTSVSASVPSPTSPALSVNVTNPTSTPSIAITANGTSSQLIDGTGALQTIPTGLPPTGTAGGDLSGTYPNPTVDGIHGIDLQSGTPTSGDVWVYGGSPAKWQHQMLHASQVDNDSAVTGTHVSDALNHLDSTKEPTITAGTTSQYWRGDKSWQTLDKSAVGLSNVDNTSDANKPISTATQTALNAKQDTLVSGTNIKTVNSTTLLGSGNLSVGTVTSVSGTGTTAGLSLSGTVTGSGSLTLSGTLSTPVNTISDSTTVGQYLVKLANPSAIRYLRINADNSVTAISAATLLSELGIGNITGTGIATLGSDVTLGAAVLNTTLVDVTGLSFPITSGSKYSFRATLIVTQSGTATGVRLAVNANVAVTSIYYNTTSSVTQNSANIWFANALDSATTAGTNVFNNTVATVNGYINANNTGTAIMRFAKALGNGGITTIKAGSFIEYTIF